MFMGELSASWDKVMSSFGLEYDLVDLTDIDALKDKIKASTKAIYFEKHLLTP